MNQRLKKAVKLGLVLMAGILGICALVWAASQSFSYGQPGAVQALLNDDGSRLYVSYYRDNKVVEIDTETMQQVRQFQIEWPAYMELSEDELYLYAISRAVTASIKRMRLSDGNIDQIILEGDVISLSYDPDGNRLWVVHRTWPMDGDVMNGPAPPPSYAGILTEIDTTDFAISQNLAIESYPISVWYSQYSDKVYVMHGLVRTEPAGFETEGGGFVTTGVALLCNPITIYGLDQDRLYCIGEVMGGFYNDDVMPAQLDKWDDDGRYMAVPSSSYGIPSFSMRVIDTYDDSVAFDLIFPTYFDSPLPVNFVKKVTGNTDFWVMVSGDIPYENLPEGSWVVVRVNTDTLEHEIYTIDQVNARLFGNFAVSPDGNTLYLTVPHTGEIIVWSPD